MKGARTRSRLRATTTYAAAGIGAVVALAAAATAGVATYLARRVTTPPIDKPDDLQILSVEADRVTLSATADSVVPGQYGLWLDRGAGHARVGPILESHDATVTRALVAVDRGELRPGPARWNQYYVAGDPGAAWGIAYENVTYPSDEVQLPAWVVPPGPAADAADAAEAADAAHAAEAADAAHAAEAAEAAGTWAVLVHGRSATREECLRAVPVLHRRGLTVAVPGYRNDRDVAAADRPGGRYHLGATEWRDIEAFCEWAVTRGARRFVLGGWSMGGAIVLQLLDRSRLADRVDAVILDSPVIDWGDVLRHTARSNRTPSSVGRLSGRLIGHGAATRLIGLEESVDLRAMNWVRRAPELTRPMLLIHSDADDVVPIGPSAVLAAARPDLVTFAPWALARHTKEWNVDPDRWESEVNRFLDGLGRPAGGALPAPTP